MASQLVMNFLMLLLALVSASTATRDLQQNGIVNQVCSLTRSPSYCNNVLNLIPGVKSEDLYNIANEMLNQGSLKSEDILNNIKHSSLTYFRMRQVLLKKPTFSTVK